MKIKQIHWSTLTFGIISAFVIPAYGVTHETSIRAVCASESGLNTKYYQQGVEVWGGDFFYDGSSMEEWMNAQDKRSGGSGDYTCYTQKAAHAYPQTVIDALKATKK